MIGTLHKVWLGLKVVFLPLTATWCVLAIYFSNLPSSLLRTGLAALFGLGVLSAFAFLPHRQRTTRWFFAAFAGILLWWLSITPSPTRDWLPEYAMLPHATIQENLVTVHNIRDFDYRSQDDFTPRYYDKTFDLRELETLDFTKSHWDGWEAIAHIILSFGFRGGDYLAVSVETRRAKGQSGVSFVHGLFKQYGLMYVVGDERDLIRLRTNFRGEDVWLYPLKATPDEIKTVFLDVLHRVNHLAETPEFYNSLTQNCTTALLPHFDKVEGGTTLDFRNILNGYVDELVYDEGSIDTELSLAEAKQFHYINQYVAEQPDSADFSLRIRPHLDVQLGKPAYEEGDPTTEKGTMP